MFSNRNARLWICQQLSGRLDGKEDVFCNVHAHQGKNNFKKMQKFDLKLKIVITFTSSKTR